MRLIVSTVVILITIMVGAYLYIVDFPYYKYSRWIVGKGQDRYFEISNYRDIYLNPIELDPIPPYQEDYVQLWKEFPLRTSLIPMPTRHPMFQTVPIVEMNGKTGVPHFGIILLDPKGREISRGRAVCCTWTLSRRRRRSFGRCYYRYCKSHHHGI